MSRYLCIAILGGAEVDTAYRPAFGVAVWRTLFSSGRNRRKPATHTFSFLLRSVARVNETKGGFVLVTVGSMNRTRDFV